MHLVGIRRTLLEEDLVLARKVYDAFIKAKDLAVNDLLSPSSPKVSLPWLNDDVARTIALAGPDFWPYGVRSNEAALASLARYAFDQGLTNRLLAVTDLFEPGLLDT
jgi:4,5-dihydroxyphthalate decarboxylase